MAFHVWQDVPAHAAVDKLIAPVIGFGWAGVDLFFVLSGFLITRILFEAIEAPHYFRAFYARRLLRTFPLYYLALVAVLALPALAGRRLVEENAWWFLLHASNIMTVLEGYPRRIVVHFWSLSIEQQFYLFWPVALRFCRTRARMLRLCAGLLAGALALRAAWWIGGHAEPYQIYNFTLTRMDALAAGGLLSLWLAATGDSARRLRVVGAIGLCALTAVAVSLWLDGPNHLRWGTWGETLGFSGVALGCGSLVGWSQLTGPERPLNRFLARPTLVSLGKYSYAMYIFHIWVDAAARAARLHPATSGATIAGTATLPMLLYFAGFLAVTSAIALASWSLFEERFLACKRHFQFGM